VSLSAAMLLNEEDRGNVSIPRSEFCVFKLLGTDGTSGGISVSIPRSEFCVFKQERGADQVPGRRGFQFPVRNSVSLSLIVGRAVPPDCIGFNSPFGILCL